MLGVLSGDVRLAVRALRDYAQALGFEFLMPQSKVNVNVWALWGACTASARPRKFSCHGVEHRPFRMAA